MLTRIVEPMSDWTSRLADGLVQATGLVHRNDLGVFVDYTTDLPEGVYPPGAVYAATQETEYVACPEDFVFSGGHWAGWPNVGKAPEPVFSEAFGLVIHPVAAADAAAIKKITGKDE